MRTRRITKRKNRLTAADLLTFPSPGLESSQRTTETAEGPLGPMINRGRPRVGYSGAAVDLRGAIVRFLATNPGLTRKQILNAYYTPLRSEVSKELRSLEDEGTIRVAPAERGKRVYTLSSRRSRRSYPL